MRTLILVVIIFLTASSITGAAATYVGPEKCKLCHPAIYDAWKTTAHAKAVVNASVALAAGYPVPEGVNPDDLAQTWMGKWKVRWVNKSGYVITGVAVQYNAIEKKFVAYDAGQTISYGGCAKCHVTGYDPNGTMFTGPNAAQSGTWQFPSVTCESCHGAGSDHIAGPSKQNIKKDTKPETCEPCHGRTDSALNVTSKNFDPQRRHRTQYNDFYNSRMVVTSGGQNVTLSMYKAGVSCINCHNPHDTTDAQYANILTKYDKETFATVKGTKISFFNGTAYTPVPNYKPCRFCHIDNSTQFPMAPKIALKHGNASCPDCHMPLSRKTAISWDERSHSMSINDGFNYTRSAVFFNYPDLTCKPCHAALTSPLSAAVHSLPLPTPTPTITPTKPATGFEFGLAAIGVSGIAYLLRRIKIKR